MHENRQFRDDFSQCYIIGEIAQAHDGSLGSAHAYIDVVADAGCDAVKFQTHIAAAESTLDEPWRVKFSYQDETRFDYWERMSFSVEQWVELRDHAVDRGLDFVSSPFSVQAVDLLNDLDVPWWKVASGEIYNPEILDRIFSTGKPVLFSSGMSSLGDLERVVRQARDQEIPFGILQCTTSYPCSPEEWGLSALDEIRKRFNCPVGMSDHSGEIYAGLAAATLGAQFLEVHVVFDKRMFGPDSSSSLTPDQLRFLVDGVKDIRRALDSEVTKDQLAETKSDLRAMFGRSWALVDNLPAGTILERKHVCLKKPAGGIGFDQLENLLGRKLVSDTLCNRLLKWQDVGGE
ncbi:MAG: N-acetylneuraminate synthase family protein [Pseudomonadales bacterium]|nr:N-acetylneuraminate synthase family protein [Pseudomonadales bacterium]MBO7004792.1 N-acetylneuraminate synthase family protein [Pseudomonadales bacterium]